MYVVSRKKHVISVLLDISKWRPPDVHGFFQVVGHSCPAASMYIRSKINVED